MLYHHRPYRHRPIYSRASFNQPFANSGLAIDPPKPSPLERPKPRPTSNPIRDFVVFIAQVQEIRRRIIAPFVPLLAVIQKISAAYQVEKQLFSAKRLKPGR